LWEVFRAALLPGLLAGPAVAVAARIVLLDVAALRRGAVPAAQPVLTVVWPRRAGAGYVAPGRRARRDGRARRRPVGLTLALAGRAPAGGRGRAGVVAAAGRPGPPALVPVLAGYALFALHVVTPTRSPAMTLRAPTGCRAVAPNRSSPLPTDSHGFTRTASALAEPAS
jgi:hypothetical protein